MQTRAEWNNVFQHMTANGSKSKEDMQAHVKRFLDLGIDNMSDEMQQIEYRLKFNPSRGYRVAMNDTHEYGMYTMDSRQFAMAERLEPLNRSDSSSGTMTA